MFYEYQKNKLIGSNIPGTLNFGFTQKKKGTETVPLGALFDCP